MTPHNPILFTSESLTEGQPDKIADQVSDAILDACLEQDPYSRVDCNILIVTGVVMVAGHLATKAYVDIEAVVRGVIGVIGYNNAMYGFDSNTCGVISSITRQSSDIAMGVDTGGAGSQSMVFGYATDETPELMPAPISLANKLTKRLAEVRKTGRLPYLRPDGKVQITLQYDRNGKPSRIENVAISAQHAEAVSLDELRSDILKDVVQAVLPTNWLDENTRYFINPTGRFVIGGPMADTGLTGRQIVADTYGGKCRHGGGSFSGKDPTKTDRFGSYMARYIAKNIVAAGLATQCEIQLVYSIGVAEPISVVVDTFDTGLLGDEELASLVRDVFGLTPRAIIESLKLVRPIYQKTATYGHFGRSEKEFAWEHPDRAGALQEAVGHHQYRDDRPADAGELLVTLVSSDDESRMTDYRWIESQLEEIARSSQAWIVQITGEVGDEGAGVITGTMAGLEHYGLIIGILGVVASPLSAVLKAWIRSRNGRKVRIKVSKKGDLDIEANSPDEAVKLLEMARQYQGDSIARVLIDRK